MKYKTDVTSPKHPLVQRVPRSLAPIFIIFSILSGVGAFVGWFLFQNSLVNSDSVIYDHAKQTVIQLFVASDMAFIVLWQLLTLVLAFVCLLSIRQSIHALMPRSTASRMSDPLGITLFAVIGIALLCSVSPTVDSFQLNHFCNEVQVDSNTNSSLISGSLQEGFMECVTERVTAGGEARSSIIKYSLTEMEVDPNETGWQWNVRSQR